jgi:hypothetical protein
VPGRWWARAGPVALLAGMVVVWFWPVLTLGETWWVSHTQWSEPLRALGVVDAWRRGIWDARWFPGFDRGYGYPFLSYYAPLFHWLSGVWTLVFGSASRGVRANLVCWLVLGTTGVFYAGRRFWGLVGGTMTRALRPELVCASGWLMSPYLLCDVYLRCDGAEFAAIQLLPWTVWAGLAVAGADAPWDRADTARYLGSVAVIAAVVLAHNFLGVAAVGVALAVIPLVFAIEVIGGRSGRRSLRRAASRGGLWVAGVAWGLVLAAFFWVPALAEMDFTRIGRMREGAYRYSDHFLVARNLLDIRFWGFGESLPGPEDTMPLHLGWVSLAASISVVAAVCSALVPSRRDGRLLAGIGVAVVALSLVLLMTTATSAPIWDRIGLLQFAQYPWRFLGIASVVVCLLLPAGGVAARPRWPAATSGAMLVGAVALFAQSAYDYVHIAGTLPAAGQTYRVDWRGTQILTTNLDEYGPIWRPTDRPGSPPSGSVVGVEPVNVTRVEEHGAGVAAGLENPSAAAGSVLVALNYFPGWRAVIEPGRELPVSPEPGSGFIRVTGIPSGASRLMVEFGDTPLRRACKLVSSVGWAVWAGVWILLAARAVERPPASTLP